MVGQANKREGSDHASSVCLRGPADVELPLTGTSGGQRSTICHPCVSFITGLVMERQD